MKKALFMSNFNEFKICEVIERLDEEHLKYSNLASEAYEKSREINSEIYNLSSRIKNANSKFT